MRIYLIRHGETDLNKQKILQGRIDFELNAYGRELARITGRALREVPFDAVYTSPLKRAKETALLLIGENLRTEQIPVIEEARIQEISFGEFEGKCYGKEGYNISDETFLNFFQNPAEYRIPKGGESFQEVIDRTGEFLQELLKSRGETSEAGGKENDADGKESGAGERTILISTHGCALKALLANVRNTPVAQFWGEGVHKNCGVTILDVQDGVVTVAEEGKLYY